MRIPIILVLLFMAANLSFAGDSSIRFFEGTLNSAIKKAKSENKRVLVEFIAGYSYDCQIMDQKSWTDPQVVELTESYFVPIKINVDDFDGVVQKKRFGVKTIPTIIFLDEEGHFLGREESALSAKELSRAISKYSGEAPAAQTKPVIPETTASKGIDRPTSVPDATPAVPHISGEAKGLFQFSARRRAQKGFSVQIGVFEDYANVLKATADLEKEFEVPILVQIIESDQEAVYKVMLGSYESYEAAAKLRGQLQKKNRNGFVKDLSKL